VRGFSIAKTIANKKAQGEREKRGEGWKQGSVLRRTHQNVPRKLDRAMGETIKRQLDRASPLNREIKSQRGNESEGLGKRQRAGCYRGDPRRKLGTILTPGRVGGDQEIGAGVLHWGGFAIKTE